MQLAWFGSAHRDYMTVSIENGNLKQYARFGTTYKDKETDLQLDIDRLIGLNGKMNKNNIYKYHQWLKIITVSHIPPLSLSSFFFKLISSFTTVSNSPKSVSLYISLNQSNKVPLLSERLCHGNLQLPLLFCQ